MVWHLTLDCVKGRYWGLLLSCSLAALPYVLLLCRLYISELDGPSPADTEVDASSIASRDILYIPTRFMC